ncbi:hypothetical protein [Mucilaginibacter sp. BT774]|uniref:hypothetical protein n=1 Tax=Mucilaginibacter sp. BT774 TaxID=3062276 RepID=UPI00267749B4|nr:hypothetical protein [Mucilaginibacter sp. BT774]MDO3626845.1 hypothetical protein [Mucilaginibacter sp. BT774]
MAITLLKHKKHKIGLTVLLVLVGIILILAFIVNQYWSPILAKRVKSVVSTSSEGLYTIDFSDAKFHILRGELDIYNITLKPDTAVYNQRLKAHLAPNNLVELHVKRLIISHMHPFMLYFQHKLEIGRIVLSQPELNVSYQQNHLKDTVVKDRRTLYQKISGSLKSIHIGDIILGDVQLKYQDYSGNQLAISELKEMNLSATDMLIDSASQTDKSRLLYCRDIVAELNNYSGRSKNGLYQYKIKSLRLSTKTSRLDIQGLDLKPVKPDVFFKNSEKDRFDVHLDTLRIDHFDYLGYHKYRVINASHMTLNSGSLNLFSNPKFILKITDRERTYPNFGLKEIRADLNIDTIDVKRINVSYTEYNHKSDQTGTIAFNNSSGRILNVTTNKQALVRNNICSVNLTSYFMNRGKLDAQFTFNLTDENLPFTYKGSIGPMDLTVLNPAIMPLGLIKVNNGRLTSFEFDIKADNSVSKGRVALLYNDLKVTVLKADTINDKLKHMTIASLFANVMVLKHDNPDTPGEAPRSFNVNYERPRDYPFFKNIWHTLLTGIKPCVGLDEKMQQDVKNKIADMAIKKQERLVKKEQRKQRRAERKLRRELKKQQKEEAQQH